jgi:hypothetical protein
VIRTCAAVLPAFGPMPVAAINWPEVQLWINILTRNNLSASTTGDIYRGVFKARRSPTSSASPWSLPARTSYIILGSEGSTGMIQLVRVSNTGRAKCAARHSQGRRRPSASPVLGAISADGEATHPCLVGLSACFTYVSPCSNLQS